MDPHDNQYQLLWMALNHLLCQMTFRHLTPWILARLYTLVKRFFKIKDLVTRTGFEPMLKA